MSADSHTLAFARLDWVSEGTPASTQHGDIYWSRDAGIAEKQHVFVEGNHLPARWQHLDRAHFTLVEIGFGFGLNFLLTARTWRKAAPRQSILNYIAFEKSPVSATDLARLYAAPGTGELPHCDEILAQYPLPSPGAHTLWIDHDIALTLVFGELDSAIGDLDASVDAWFLDGFSPARNADAWTGTLYRHMQRLSRPGATISTYSVAGDVRRGLGESGFAVEKTAGFATKAEMLTGRFTGSWQPNRIEVSRVAIVGAGIAGFNCARALMRRGIDVRLYDKTGPLAGASALPALAVYPQLAMRPQTGTLFSLSAFGYAMRIGNEVHTPGRLTLAKGAHDSKDIERLERIAGTLPDDFARFVKGGEASDIAAARIDRPALFYPAAGWLETQALADVTPVETASVADVNGNIVSLADGRTQSFDAVVITTGADNLAATEPFGFEPVRGQAIRLPLAKTKTGNPNTVLGGPVYVIPYSNEECLVGATYAKGDAETDIRETDTIELTARLSNALDIHDMPDPTGAWTGVRCTTRDRTPVVGRLPRWPELDAYCAALPGSSQHHPFDAYQADTYICTGFGSHGATHAALCAEQIARMITGEPVSIGKSWSKRLDPARLKIRQARTRQRS